MLKYRQRCVICLKERQDSARVAVWVEEIVVNFRVRIIVKQICVSTVGAFLCFSLNLLKFKCDQSPPSLRV